MDWFPWYFDIYAADTMHLTPYQDGCYRRLIDHYMKTRQPLPDNDFALARIVGDSVENWLAMAAGTVRAFFTAEAGRLTLSRCDDILLDQDTRRRTLSESGKKGAEIRRSASQAAATLKPPLSPASAQDRTGQDRKKKEPPLPPSDFDAFWELFPKQRAGSRDNARTAYQKALTRTTAQEIANGVQAYSRSDEVARGFAKGAAAWLNDDRWAVDYARSGGSHPAVGAPTKAERAAAAADRGLALYRAGRALAGDGQSVDRTVLRDVKALWQGTGDAGASRCAVPDGAGALPAPDGHSGIPDAPADEG